MASPLPARELTIFDIPTEVRVQIWKLLPPPSRLQVRLTSKKVKEEIDEHSDFQISVDQQAFRGFRKLFRYRVTFCKIANLTHQNLNRGPLFAHPSKLKKLVLDGQIIPGNLLKILTQCNEIDSLTLTHESMGITNLLHSARIQQSLQRSLMHVTHLNVQLLRYPLGNPFGSENNMNSILSLTLPCLKSLKLYFSLWGNYVKLLLFLGRHSKTLEDLELQLGDRGDVRNAGAFVNANRALINNLQGVVDMSALTSLNLKTFHFRDDVLNLTSSVAQMIMGILEKQTQLRVLQFHSPGEMRMTNLRTIVKANEKSLQEVVVYNLKISNPNPGIAGQALNNVNVSIPLDMSIFQNCKSLETLALSCTTRLSNGVETSCVRLSNLHLLPGNLETLHLTGFQLDLNEVVTMSRSMTKLKQFLISDAGVTRYSVLLRTILRNCERLEYFHVRPILTRAHGDADWWEEKDEVSKFYSHFMQIPYDPLDDLDGFEANITELDRQWLLENVSQTPL